MNRPTDVAAVQRLLGFVNYLARFMPHLSDVCEPLRRLTDKESLWDWQSSQEQAFQKIKQLATEAPVLRYYNVADAVTLQCDSSDFGLGATLLQCGQPVAFASRALSSVEQRYAQIEKEMLSIVFGCERFRQYICGREVIHVHTDHKPLEMIFQKPLMMTPKRLQSMRLRLQDYSLKVKYIPGRDMHIADFLSRAPLPLQPSEATQSTECVFTATKLLCESEIYHDLEQVNATEFLCATDSAKNRMKSHVLDDPTLLALKHTVLKGWPEQKTDLPSSVCEYWNVRDEISVHEGLLFRGSRVIVPKTLRSDMIKQIHSGHFGIEACVRRARDILYWPGMQSDIRQAVKQCKICNEHKPEQARQPMISHPVPDRPWSTISADLFTLDGRSYLIVVDHYSDFWEVDELEETTSKDIIRKLMIHFSRHGIPDIFISDNGPQFSGSPFTTFAQEWSFRHVTSSPLYSRSNGKAESAVKIAKSIFKKCKADGSNVWRAILDWRNTPTDSVGSSPSQRLMSRRTRTYLPVASRLLQPQVITGVRENLMNKRHAAKKQYDRGTRQLPQLLAGQPVRIRLRTGSHNLWTEGTCLGQVAPQSYNIRTNRGVFRRNRQMIRVASDLEKHQSHDFDTHVWDSHDSEDTNASPSGVADIVSPKLSVTSSDDKAVADQDSSPQASDTNEVKSSTHVPSKAHLEDIAGPSVTTGRRMSPKRSKSGRIIQPPLRYRESS